MKTILFSVIYLLAIATGSAAVTVTAASGGTAISADKAANASSPAWTALGPITLTESNTGGGKADLATGVGVTLVLQAPTGFQFNSAVIPSVSYTAGKDVSAASVAITSSNITVTFTVTGTANVDSITLGGTTAIQVRPTAGTPLASGNIYRPLIGGGTAVVNGITASANANGSGGTSFGALSEVVGNVSRLVFTTQPVGGLFGTILPTQPVIKTQDQFGNNSTSGLASTLNVTTFLSSGTGALSGTRTNNIGTSGGNGTVTHSNLQVTEAGSKQLGASASGLATATSATFEVAKLSQTLTFGPLTNRVYGEQFQLTATASSGLPVTYSVIAGSADITGTLVTVTTGGLVTIRASQAGNVNYEAAPDIDQTFMVNKVPLAIKADDKMRQVGEANPVLTATYVGLTGGDTALDVPVVLATSADETSAAGAYSITIATVSSPKYEVSLFPGKLWVLTPNTISSTVAGGNWSHPGTWVGGVVPTAQDNVTIAAGARVTVDSAVACFSLTLQSGTSTGSTGVVTTAGSLVVGGGNGLVTMGSEMGSLSQSYSTALDVSGSLQCGQMTMLARRINNRDAETFLTLSSSTAVVDVRGDISQDRNAVAENLRNQIRFNAAGLLRVKGEFVSLMEAGMPSISGSGSVEYYDTAPQRVAAFAYNNLILSGSGVKTVWGTANEIMIGGILTLKDEATYAGPTPVYENNTSVAYRGTVPQVTGAEVPSTPPLGWSFSADNAEGVTLTQSLTVSNMISLVNGPVITGPNVLTAEGNIVRTSGYVIGSLRKKVSAGSNVSRTFEVGSATGYAPVSVVFASVTTGGYLVAQSQTGDHPAIGSSQLSPNFSANVNWTITPQAPLAFNRYNVTLNFENAVLDNGVSTSLLLIGKLDNGVWTYPTVAARSGTSIEAHNLTSFSSFQVAEIARIAPVISWQNPGDIVYGTALGVSQLNAQNVTPGSFSYSPAPGTVLNAGSNQVLSAVFMPADPTVFAIVTNTVVINVLKAPLSATAGSATRMYGETNPVVSCSLVGVVNGDDITASCVCLADSTSAAGPYQIVPVLEDPNNRLSNYAVTLTNGELTVTGVSAPGISISRLGSIVKMKVSGPTHLTYTIQSVAELGGEWQPLGVATVDGEGVLTFEDPDAGAPTRFYRAVRP